METQTFEPHETQGFEPHDYHMTHLFIKHMEVSGQWEAMGRRLYQNTVHVRHL